MCPGVRWVPGCSVFLPADFDHDRQCYRQCGDVAKAVEHMIAAAHAAAFKSGNRNVIHAHQDDLISMQTLTDKLAAAGNNPVWVEGALVLEVDDLDSLPESFGNLRVEGDLNLSYQCLSSLPDSFGHLVVGGNLDLGHQQLSSLPESFGNLVVGGKLNLSHNQLESLPESFDNLVVRGDLRLDKNELQSLPESFANLKVGGELHLAHNQLESLPESFGNLVVRGDLRLDGNPLEIQLKRPKVARRPYGWRPLESAPQPNRVSARVVR